MAGKKLELGPTGRTVASNVARFREAARYNYTELSKELAKYGRDIPPLAVRRIEEGNRRIDVDDLVALALALNVSLLALLLPREDSALVPNGEVFAAERIWNWGHGVGTLQTQDGQPVPATFAFAFNSNPFADWSTIMGIPKEVADQLRNELPHVTLSPQDVEITSASRHFEFRSDQSGHREDDHGES